MLFWMLMFQGTLYILSSEWVVSLIIIIIIIVLLAQYSWLTTLTMTMSEWVSFNSQYILVYVSGE